MFDNKNGFEILKVVNMLTTLQQRTPPEHKVEFQTLQDAINILTKKDYVTHHVDNVFLWDASDLQHANAEVQRADGHLPQDIIPLKEEQIENIFFDLNENDSLRQRIESEMCRLVRKHTPKFRPGQKVYWSDPDNNIASGYAIVKNFNVTDDPIIYTLEKTTGGFVEAPEHEIFEAKEIKQ